MKYALLIYGNPGAFDPATMKEIGPQYMSFSQEIIDSDEMVGGDPFEGVDTAISVRVRDGQIATNGGPFAKTSEVLSGYYIIDVKDLDRAVELAAKVPDARTGVVEVRPLGDIPAQATEGAGMNGEELVHRYTDEFKNRSNFDVVDELFTDDFIHHLPFPGLPAGRDGMKAVGHVVTGAVRDITVTLDIVVTDGKFVADRTTARGIRNDNDQEVTWNEHKIWRIDNGRLVEQWSIVAGLDIG